MSVDRKKEWAFVLFVIAIGLLLLFKTVRFSFDEGEIALTITPQNGGITNIDTPRKPKETHVMYLRRIDFAEGRMLENDQYGKMGYASNFFLDARVEMNVRVAGVYRFTVRSDDGFRLLIDGRTVCEHPGDRPFQATSCQEPLTQGKHLFVLHYFQGGGPMGLQASYAAAGKKTRYFIGEDSDLMTFEKIQ